jgi:PAS domain S-box-containing protein
VESAADIEALAESWVAMAQAATLDDVEAATLAGIRRLTSADIAYTARYEDGVWTIGSHVGLTGDVAGVAIPKEQVSYNDALLAGETICYEDARQMGPELANALGAVGVSSLFAVPIMNASVCVGGIGIARNRASTFSQRERALLRLFASRLTVLISNRQLTQSLETLAEAVPAIVLRTDPSGWINWYNHRWYSFTGQTREEAAGWGWQTAHHPEDFLRVMEEWPQALATGQPIEIEFRLRRYDGVYHWHLARVEPMKDEQGRVISWYGTVVDIEAQKQALERTKRVAEVLQHAFLPGALPQRSDLRIDAFYASPEQDALVGGDWYDAFELPDGRIGFSVGDVAGHGIEASIVVGNLRQTIFALALHTDDPAEILAETNRILRMQNPGMFVTAIAGFVDTEKATMFYASAGHPPPIVAYRTNVIEKPQQTGGPLLGAIGDPRLSTCTVAIEPDAVVAFYTDGITEFARDSIAGEAALTRAVSSLVHNVTVAHPARLLHDTVLGDASPRDDVALLVFQFSPIDASQFVDDRPVMPTKRWRFHASDARAAHVARLEVASYLQRVCGETEETFASVLIVGELLANTVAHAPGLVELTVEFDGDRSVLIVRDSGPGLEALRTSLPDDPFDEGSRGLFLVHAMSGGVSVVPSESGGAELRVLLPLRARQTSGPSQPAEPRSRAEDSPERP